MSDVSSEPSPIAKRPWLRRPTSLKKENLGSPPRVIVVTLLIFLFSQAILAPVLVSLGYSLIHPHSHLDINNSIAAQFYFVLIAEAFIALVPIYIVKKRGLSIRSIGLGRNPNTSDLWRAAIGFGAFYALLIAVGVVINIFWPNLFNNQNQDIGFNNLSTGADRNLALIALVIFPPIGEEILMRGYLYSGLRYFWQFWPSLLVTSLLFGTAHLFESSSGLLWAAGIDTFLLSFILVYLREKTGALYAGMLVHVLNNFIAFGVHFK
jgi:membrane protease YdiL (CAAX protease family)